MTREEEIFAQALALPPAERAAFLDRACADDPALRTRLHELLTAHEESAAFLAGSLASRLHPVLEEQPGDTIGRYRLIRKLGEGGCGVVYLAEQTDPVRRLVALKIIRLGMNTREVVTRFEAERQALAVMDHPGIAHVYDAGVTAQGRPYFAMEYVEGQPITKYCDEKQLSTAARLELFAEVCLALQHAHQKSIVHRDVKPTNILVGELDGRPAPKIIDFGIAKATQGRLTDATLLTALDQFIGTPSYMSPEQADLRTIDIDTRSDIYSLGVLLYELLTGRPPFDPKTLVAAGVAEIRRIIREVEPPRPSTALSTLGRAERTTVAQRRAAAPERLTSVLRGDLDWIVMRCLEKDRTRRYGTASELVEDVRRHLRSEPIVARPPSAVYRTQKFIRRHRVACASAAAIAAALILGTVVSVTQAVRANRAEQDARRRQAEAEELLTFMLGDFRTELQKIGKLQLLDAVGDKAMAYFAALDPRDLTDTALSRQAKAIMQIGEVRMSQARYGEAGAAFALAYARAARLADRYPKDADLLFERAQVEFWLGHIAREQKDRRSARRWLTQYLTSSVALAALDGGSIRAQIEVASGHHNLAVLDVDDFRLILAQQEFEAEAATMDHLLQSDPRNSDYQARLAESASWLGLVCDLDGRYRDAIDRYTQMLSRYRQLAAREPNVASWQVEVARSHMFLGQVQLESGHRNDAKTSYQSAKALLEVLVAHDPQNRLWRDNAVDVSLIQSRILLAEGQPAAAATLLGPARAQLESQSGQKPESKNYRRLLATAWRLAAWQRSLEGHDALEEAKHAADLARELVERNPADPLAAAEHAQGCLLAAQLLAKRGQSESSRLYAESALQSLIPFIARINDSRILDPALQAYTLAGRSREANRIATRLHRFGYTPIDPFPASLLEAAPPQDRGNHQP